MKKFVLLGLILVVLGSLVVGASSCSSAPLKVQVATDATWEPFEYVNDQTNELEGFDIDLMNAIAAEGEPRYRVYKCCLGRTISWYGTRDV